MKTIFKSTALLIMALATSTLSFAQEETTEPEKPLTFREVLTLTFATT